MFTWICRIGLVCSVYLSIGAAAEVVYSDGMQTTSGWNEASNAADEAGDSTGGIQVVGGDHFQMNSWWGSPQAGWTSIWKSTGHLIQADTIYRCTMSIVSYAGGTAVTLKLTDVDNNWADMETVSVNPSTSSYSNYVIIFDSSQYPAAVGHTLGVEIDAGWWNNLGVTQITIETNPPQGNAVYFTTTDPGVTKSLDFWGECQTWISSDNMTSCINYMGLSNIDVVRIGLDVSQPLTYSGGVPILPAAARSIIDSAMVQAQRAPNAMLSIMPGGKDGDLNSWYLTSGKINPVRWVDAFLAAINYVNSTYGYTMSDWTFVEVFNEPDWNWSAGSQSNMASVMAEYKNRTALAGVPLLGPSTLSCDSAQSWYNAIAGYTDIAGTHVINGSMSSLINFINNVHAAGKPFINPEIHSLVESIIHAEYSDRPGEGGIFWGDITPTEGRFVQACTGKRIAYATDPVTWSAACGYRDLQQRTWLFTASNERHALPSMWEFRCTDRDVFFDNVGPTRSWIVKMGSHDDEHVEVTWGDRNPLYFYQYMNNAGNNTRLAVSGSLVYTTTGTSTITRSRWEFRPVGAFYYIDNFGTESTGGNCRLSADSATQALIVSANTRTDDFAKWQLTKIGDNYFLENVGMQRAGLVCRLKTGSGSTVVLTDSSDVTDQAIWIFTDTGFIDTAAPAAPANLTAITGDSKIQLNWTDSDAWDFDSYSIYRKTNVGSFVKIADGLAESHYEDSTAVNNTYYRYVVTAADGFGNESAYSNQADMAAQTPVAYDDFQGANFTGGYGWTAGWSTSGSPTVVTSGTNKIVKLTNTASMRRTLSTPVHQGTLYFKYDVDALEADDSVVAEVYDWITAQWIPVWSGHYYDNGLDSVGGGVDTPDNLQEQFVDIGSVCVNISQIRFRAISNSSDDVLFIDDVAVFPKMYGAPTVDIVYSDNMTTLTNGWNEGSGAAAEAGDGIGGIRAVDYGDGLNIHMNSWWDNAQWTKIWKSTGSVIASNTAYKLRVTITSFASGKTLTLKLQNVTKGWTDIATASLTQASGGTAEYTVSFSTANGQNSQAVGDQLGILIDPGWWNSLLVERVVVEKNHVYLAGDLNRSGREDIVDFAIFAQGWQTNYGTSDLALFAQDWLKTQ